MKYSHGYIRFLRFLRLSARILLVALGAACYSMTIRCFYEPNQLLSGGINGTSLLVGSLTGFPVGLGAVLLNIPVFLLAFRDVGRRFTLLSALGVLFFWLFTDFLPLEALTLDPMLGAIFGGVLAGLGTSIALKAGGSLGGFDIIGVYVNRRFSTGVGEVLMLLNGLLVAAAGLTASPEAAMHTLIGIFTAGRILDALQTPRPRKAFLIVTSRPEELLQRITTEMNRGVTIWTASGAAHGRGSTILMCVVTRAEMRELADIVRETDSLAFTVVLEASQVLGHFRKRTTLESIRRMGDRGQEHSHPRDRIF